MYVCIHTLIKIEIRPRHTECSTIYVNCTLACPSVLVGIKPLWR